MKNQGSLFAEVKKKKERKENVTRRNFDNTIISNRIFIEACFPNPIRLNIYANRLNSLFIKLYLQ